MRTRRRRTTVTSEVTMAAAGMAWDRVPKVVHVRPKSIESSRFGWINVHTRWNSQSLEDDAAWRAHGLHSWRVSPCIYAQTSFPIKLIHTKKLGSSLSG